MKDIYDGSYLVEDQDGHLRRKRRPDDMLCDFCCAPLGSSCWTYPCGELELPLAGDPTGLPAVSNDAWACCQDCHPLVESKDWRKLAERSLLAQCEANGLAAMLKYTDFLEDACPEIIQHFERFDAARTGDSYEEHAPYTDH